MNRYDYFSGEPIAGSPNFSPVSGISTDIETLTGSQQTQNNYSYDPNARSIQMNQQMQQSYYFPGQYGYNAPNPYQTYGGFNMSMASQPMVPYMNPPIGTNMGFQGFQGNPAFAFMNGMNMGMNYGPYFRPQEPIYQDKVVHVPGFNTGTEVLYPDNIEEICNQLQLEMIMEQEEAQVEREKRFQGYFNNNYGNNYYGMPFVSNFIDQGIYNKYRGKIEQIKQEAIERRSALNKGLSRLVHNYMNDNMTDEDIDRVYDGYTYTIPSNTVKLQYDADRFSRMQPISNQHLYAQHFKEIGQIYDSLVNPKSNMQQFLQAQGMVQIFENLQDEMHKRRDGSRYYQEDGYRRFLRKAIMERKGIKPTEENNQNSLMGNAFPVLSQSANMLEDGTLNITAPAWLGGRQITINNELEQHFEENRHKFLQSIYAQGGS